jgi:hypothetical protein
VVPRLLSETDAQDLESIAARVLHYHGFQPRIYEDEDAARENVDADVASGRYPLLLTPLDTVGEKPYEEFVSAGEQAVDFHMLTLLAIKYQGVDCAVLDELLDNLRMLVSSPDVPVTKQQIVASLVDVIPEFHHADTGKHLDDRL